jgi:hypothetical protein
MKSLRNLLSMIVVGLLVLGYAGSQVAALQGNGSSYASKIDSPPIQLLSLAILLGCVVLAFIPDKGANEK